MEISFKVGDLNKLISESSNEFKAVLGPNVEKENKKNSEKAYSDSKKRAKEYDGGLKDDDFAKGTQTKHTKYEKHDENYTLMDVRPGNMSDETAKRWKVNAMGYNSEMEKNNGIEKIGDFSDNENIYDGMKDCGEKMRKNKQKFKEAGLRGHNIDPKEFEENSAYVNESKDGFDMRYFIDNFNSKLNKPQNNINENKLDIIYFKQATFLTEGHMLSKIPDDFKTEGKNFKMKDSTGNEYIIEWRNNQGNIIGHSNKKGMKESLDRMSSMYNYFSNDSKTTQEYRLNENNNFKQILDKTRKMKNNDK